MKYIIYLNILLLIKFTSAAELFVSSIPDVVDQTNPVITEDTLSEIGTTAKDIFPSTIIPEDDSRYKTINDTINTNSSANVETKIDNTNDSELNTSDSSFSTTENVEDLFDTYPLPKLPEEELDEIEDMKNGGNFVNIPKTIDEDDEIILPYPIENDILIPTIEVEWIQEDEQEPADDVDIPPFVQAITDTSHDGIQEYFMQGQIGIILASLLIVSLVCVYIGFVAWRRLIVKRYGNREILINEDDMIDPNDMKYFTL